MAIHLCHRDAVALHELFTLLLATMAGGRARRLRSAGWLAGRFGGPSCLPRFFPPVSADEATSREFHERHLAGMRREVAGAVQRVFSAWPDPVALLDRQAVADWFVVLGQGQLLLHDRTGCGGSSATRRLGVLCRTLHDALAGEWLNPIVLAKLRAAD